MEIRKAVTEFARARGIQLRYPEVVPAVPFSQVAIVYGSSQGAQQAARDLMHALESTGVNVSFRAGRIQNHFVTQSRVAVFVRDISEQVPARRHIVWREDETNFTEFTCLNQDDEAIIYLSPDGAFEVQSYVWQKGQITGKNYYGDWSLSDELLELHPRNLDPMIFRSALICDSPSLPYQERCIDGYTWVAGSSIPILQECPFVDRDLYFE